MPPNIVWIMTDQQRRDCTGAYTDRPVRTPNLDRLADASVVFDNHYSTCPLCVPARSSLHTGRFTHSCGAVINGFSKGGEVDHATLNDGEMTIGERLADAGYHVGHVGIDHVRTLPHLRQKDRFATFLTRTDHRRYVEDKGLQSPDMRPHQHDCPTRFGDEIQSHWFSAPNPGRHPFDPEDFEDFYFAREATRFIEEAPDDNPFFLMCFLWMPHPPFVIPEPYFSMFNPQDIDLPANVAGAQDGKPPMHLEHLPGQVGANHSLDEWRETWAAYYGCVALADDCIGQVLDAVEARTGGDDTLVVFHPDHGEMLGAHSYFQKMVCYEEAIHLPMMVSAPGVEPGRRSNLTSHVDIAPTIAQYAGLDVPDAMQGRSLMPLLRDADTPHHNAVFSEYNGNVVRDLYQRCIVSDHYKYIWNMDDFEELYDLASDPLEEHNIAREAQAESIKTDLRDRLACWMDETGDFIRLN